MASKMLMRVLGTQGLKVPMQGLGCMGMTEGFYRVDTKEAEEESLAVINRALDLGFNFLDTATFYGPHLNEELIGTEVAQ